MEANQYDARSPAGTRPLDIEEQFFIAKRKYQQVIDRVTPMKRERWAAVAFLCSVLLLRMYIKQGYAVIAYLFGLYFLQNTMLYLSPLDDPEECDDEVQAQHASSLLKREAGEHKGFVRKMSEVEFWRSMFIGSFLAAFFSLFDGMDIEIYWPLLVVYFCGMTLFLCRVKLEHMWRYGYVPVDSFGKEKYKKAKPGEERDSIDV